MVNIKITDLTVDEAPTIDDVIEIVDIATDTSKQASLGDLPVSNPTAAALALKADDNAVVKLEGDQTISGEKTFVDTVVVPTPTTDFTAATKKYVDDNSAIPVESSKYVPTGGWTSLLHGYILAETLGYDLEHELADSAFTGALKPLWIGMGAAGAYERYDQDIANEWGYSVENLALFDKYAGKGVLPFVSESYQPTGDIADLMASPTLRTAWITAAVADCVALGWNGISVDVEGFGTWTEPMTDNYYAFITELSAALKAAGKLITVYIPPIWNTAPNTESGSGDPWDSANSQSYYPYLTYANLALITDVDYWEIPLYDYEFDYGSEAPEAPLRWIADVANFAKTFFPVEKIIIGLSAQGHYGADGYADFNNWTYAQAALNANFNQAQRDASSGELYWKPSTINYWIADSRTMDIRRLLCEFIGIKHVAMWYLGDNKYPSPKDAFAMRPSEPTMRFDTDYPATGKFVNTTVLTGTATYTAAGLTLSTGATASSSQRNLFTFLNDSNAYPIFKSSPTIELCVSMTTPITRLGQWYGGLGNITVNGAGHTFTGAHIGFKIVGNGSTATLSATVANGTTETATVLCTIAANDNIMLRAVVNPRGDVDFFYNKNFAGWTPAFNIATNLPTEQTASPYVQQSVSNIATANVFTVISTKASVTY
jgi:hypothetical protein